MVAIRSNGQLKWILPLLGSALLGAIGFICNDIYGDMDRLAQAGDSTEQRVAHNKECIDTLAIRLQRIELQQERMEMKQEQTRWEQNTQLVKIAERIGAEVTIDSTDTAVADTIP